MAACALAVAFGLVAAVILCLRREYARRTLGWRLLAHAGWPLILVGAMFVVRFWTPTSGPYVANSRYPFGDHLAAWAVSFGFTWIAFGLLFAALAVLAPAAGADGRPPRLAWLALLATWALCWFPHGIIGLAVAVGGLAPESTARYDAWAHAPGGTLTLVADAVFLAVHFACSVAGFALAAREVWGSRAGSAKVPTVPRAA
jgi:hypothetical protein